VIVLRSEVCAARHPAGFSLPKSTDLHDNKHRTALPNAVAKDSAGQYRTVIEKERGLWTEHPKRVGGAAFPAT